MNDKRPPQLAASSLSGGVQLLLTALDHPEPLAAIRRGHGRLHRLGGQRSVNQFANRPRAVGDPDQDALIVGLFRKLPPPESDWAEEDGQKWLQTAANIFDLVYKGECGGFIITPARAERSPRPRD